MSSTDDHMYTNTIYNTNTYDPAEFTYKLTPNETHDLVKLRVSNQGLFTGRRNASRCAWRAILKHMGLQWKMTPSQAMKKWENLKKKYKELKYPPEGVRVHPEQWRYYQLVNDAIEGRLVGSAPLLVAILPGDDGDFLPDTRPRKRLEKRPPLLETVRQAGKIKSEIEVRISGEEEEEEGEEEEEEEEGEEEGSSRVMDCALGEAEDERIMMEGEREVLEGDRAVLESEREGLEREKMALERERGGLDREMASMDRDRALLEREKAAMEREKAVMERERALLETDKAAVSRERSALERERVLLERDKVALQQQKKTGMGNGTEGTGGENSNRTDSQSLDRRERFLNLFEKLIDTL